MEIGISEYRNRLEKAHLMYQMGYSYKDKNIMLEKGVDYREVDNIATDMYDIYASVLAMAMLRLGQEVVEVYDDKDGNVKGSEIRDIREKLSALSNIMLKDSHGLFEDVKALGFTLIDATKFTLVDKYLDCIPNNELDMQCDMLDGTLKTRD